MTQTPQEDYVLLVTPSGNIIGTKEKMQAHHDGDLHRAFSVFLFNNEGKMLIQQRADSKYHFAGLWSNACCSHQRVDENNLAAAHRRLPEELGFDTPLTEAFTFLYKTYDPISHLTEHELDTVLVGIYNDRTDIFNPKEVKAVRWIGIAELFFDIDKNPNAYTLWFKIALNELRGRKLLSVANIKKQFKKNNSAIE